jgi:hypothetical protein
MSDTKYPKVKGYCTAGCARRVPSYEEYQDNLIRVVDQNDKPFKGVVLVINEETREVNIKLPDVDTETPTE